jgi:hypothetical protein
LRPKGLCEKNVTLLAFFLLRLPGALRKYRLTEANGTRKRGVDVTAAEAKRSDDRCGANLEAGLAG